ncbi:alpha-hydroxy acid oxidase [Sphaerotilus sp.]|uniref:alpha-hydroxy acid oxidase n=1 Tax=Sphaerotilus sp. TaxID=2093942 RepID=UPI0025D83C78|nr:alpha-hydroxy acid oxidase [Sphaerotilus sp.]
MSPSVPFATSIEDLRCQAQRRIPRMFYDYVDAGSWTEGTYRANTERLRDIHLCQRVAVNLDGRHVRSTMLGQPVALPVALGPAGLAGMLHPDGEIHAARAAEAFGVPFALSTMSICSIEDVAAATQKPFWFQLYLLRDRGFSASLIERAKAARCSALILTLDAPVLGRRYKDVRNGLNTAQQWYRPRMLLDFVSHPRWCRDMLRTPRRGFGNMAGHAPGTSGNARMSDWKDLEVDCSLTWDDIEWVRRQWDGPLILKGLMDPTDARRAAEMGVAAIVVSNHGGRQLDGSSTTIDTLPRMVEAVRAVPGGRTEVWMDSGIRSGQDVLKALALGAQAVLIGRAYLYGLAAQGQAGVTRCLEILSEDLELSMAMCGHVRVGTLDRSVLVPETCPT